MTEALYERYPEVYEALYRHKDYDAEVGFVLDRLGDRGLDPADALIVGCGTGEHGRRLADAGVRVLGVDRYEAMVGRARSKVDDERAEDGAAEFRVDALPDLGVEGRFDLVWAPFTVVNHLDPDAFPAGLAALAERVRPGGALVFDSTEFGDTGDWTWVRTFESEDGPVARVGDVERLTDRRVRWHSVVFGPGEWFVDRHDLYVPETDYVRGALEALGFDVAVHDGYGEDHRSDSPTFVALRSGQ